MTEAAMAMSTQPQSLQASEFVSVLESGSVQGLGRACQEALERLTGSAAIGIYLLQGGGPRLVFSDDVPRGFLDDYAKTFGPTDPLIRGLGADVPVTDGETCVGAEKWRKSPLNDLLRSWGFCRNMCGLMQTRRDRLGVIYAAHRSARGEYSAEIKEQMRYLCHGASVALNRLLDEEAREGPQISPQLRRVADLLCDGLSNKQIARAIGLSDHTVKEYVQILLQRYEAENRTALAVSLVRSGALTRSSTPDMALTH